MRDTFARAMTQLAAERSDICLLSGDIGNRMFDRFKECSPDRFINCGIAEANMMSVAAGMALNGMHPFVYTITPFTTARCLEQIKIGVAYHEASVTIVGTGSGLSYAELGATHHSLDDIAMLRSIPGMRIFAPADSTELLKAMQACVDGKFPSYIRIGKKGEPELRANSRLIDDGLCAVLREGNDAALLGIGPVLGKALEAVRLLEARGISVSVASMNSVKPLSEELMNEVAEKFRYVITLEEHSLIGGLGSSVLEWINQNDYKDIKVTRIGVHDEFIHELGNQEFVRSKVGLSVEDLALRVTQALCNDSGSEGA